MEIKIREWKIDDKSELAENLNNMNIMNNRNFVFENTDIIRIYAEPFAYNSASCRVLEKAGFGFEGVLKSNAFKNGNIVDMKMYALVKQ